MGTAAKAAPECEGGMPNTLRLGSKEPLAAHTFQFLRRFFSTTIICRTARICKEVL